MAEAQKILLCTDLDRTIIPNGFQTESIQARPVFRRLSECPKIYLAYVSGRDKKLILEAIEEFYLPVPNYAIGDVGTTLYRIINGNWQPMDDWSRELGRDWISSGWKGLAELFEDFVDLQLQEPEKQNHYKLSYYTDQNIDHQRLIGNIHNRLAKQGVRASVIWSIDETRQLGLLDIIPTRANKLNAIQFLLRTENFSEDRTIFAGDSGNDLDALTSGMKSILVKNALEDVRKEAIQKLSDESMIDRLYLPQGNFFGMNGNYAAGVLEGLAHFIPDTAKLIAEAVKQSKSLTLYTAS